VEYKWEQSIENITLFARVVIAVLSYGIFFFKRGMLLLPHYFFIFKLNA